MAKVRFEESRATRFLKKQGVFLALAACLFAAGVSGAVISSNRQQPAPVDQTASNVKDTSSKQTEQTETSSKAPRPESSLLASQPQTPTSSTAQAPYFVLPIAGAQIMKGFDDTALQYSATYRDWRLHTAVDLKAAVGTVVCSAANGTVTEVFRDANLGTCVRIDHGGGIVASYYGLNAQPVVKVGQSVSAGTQIGAVDAVPCESVEHAHLHLSVTVDDLLRDPLEVFGFVQ